MALVGVRRALLSSKKAVLSGAGWDAANAGAGLTVSNGRLTVKQTSSNGTEFSIRSTTSHSIGKFYFEFASVYSSGGLVVPAGFGNASATIASSGYVVGLGDNNSIGSAGTGNVYYRNAVLATAPSVTSNLSVFSQVAIDIGGQLLWFRNALVSTNWNLSGAADPATGAGGISISPSLTGALYIAATLFNVNDEVDLNLGGTAYAFTPPSGFGNW